MTATNDHPLQSPATKASLTCVFIDLEVRTDKSPKPDVEINPDLVYAIGLVTDDFSEHWNRQQFDYAADIIHYAQRVTPFLCGHNIRRFDMGYLTALWPDLAGWSLIDTLELSHLVFPLQHSHSLGKDYKLSRFTSNDPQRDAELTRDLLEKIIDAFANMEVGLRSALVWLITAGDSETDTAYRQFMTIALGLNVDAKPPIYSLPQAALSSMRLDQLTELWADAANIDFEDRLCLAYLLAWNSARIHLADTRTAAHSVGHAPWMLHRPTMLSLLYRLFLLPQPSDSLIGFLHLFGGKTAFKEQQEPIIRSILAGDNPFIVLPTSGGKSLCFQLSALVLARHQGLLTVVISPLQALMADQVEELEHDELFYATYINGLLDAQERRESLTAIRRGEKTLLYISPEQLRSTSMRSLLEELRPRLWIIDEAHCISQWGHDFRPDFCYIPTFIKNHYPKDAQPMLALMTATATQAVIDDIRHLFAREGLLIGPVIKAPMKRPNLHFRVDHTGRGGKRDKILDMTRWALNQSGSAIIYTTKRESTEQLVSELMRVGIEGRAYHGGLQRVQKKETLAWFKSHEPRVVAATSAFGMGINRPDVRAVIHDRMSFNLEEYIQQAGRAGRDGQDAICQLHYNRNDVETIFYLQAQSQVTQLEMENAFLTIRAMRDKLFSGKAVEDRFWMTSAELVPNIPLKGDPERLHELRELKAIQILHFLEEMNLITRDENQTTTIKFELAYREEEQSKDLFHAYAAQHNISNAQIKVFHRLIEALHRAGNWIMTQESGYPIDLLSDYSGIQLREIPALLEELGRANVCTSQTIVLFLLKRRGIRQRLNRLISAEQNLKEALLAVANGRHQFGVNPRHLAHRVNKGIQRIADEKAIRRILHIWAERHWLAFNQQNRDVISISAWQPEMNLDACHRLCAALIHILFDQTKEMKTSPVRIDFDYANLKSLVRGQLGDEMISDEVFRDVIVQLDRLGIYNLLESPMLISQAYHVGVRFRAQISTVAKDFSRIVQQHYENQTTRTHAMVTYCSIVEDAERERFIEAYFALDRTQLLQNYPELNSVAARRPILPEDYEAIFRDLKPSQSAIVLADDPAIVVLAGPGSGKTKTIVHRMAYLTKVCRVQPDRIIALAYNRNAADQLRTRLRSLIGATAGQVRIYTFHQLALRILGQTADNMRDKEREQWDDLITEACDRIEQGDTTDAEERSEWSDEDLFLNYFDLVGDVEYLFVDEYQDVTADTYRFIKLLAGKHIADKDQDHEGKRIRVNLCVIGDDDQSLYEFKGANPQYLRQFEVEYGAKRYLLTENHRSTKEIVSIANHFISHNQLRAKLQVEEQVVAVRHIDHAPPVQAYAFDDEILQTAWIVGQIKDWIAAGIAPQTIAILGLRWKELEPIRERLEAFHISTHLLKKPLFHLHRHALVVKLLNAMASVKGDVFDEDTLILGWCRELLAQWDHSETEPTAHLICSIFRKIDDRRRVQGDAERFESITTAEVKETIYEFGKDDYFAEYDAVLISTCHSSKGLEFDHVIVLANKSGELTEAERRVFYVAMTRAKDVLVLTGIGRSPIFADSGLAPETPTPKASTATGESRYIELTLKDVWLSCPDTKNAQWVIAKLREGDPLLLLPYRSQGWSITTKERGRIGALSEDCVATLAQMGITFQTHSFKPNEVVIGAIYRHIKKNKETDEIEEDHFVVVPTIRILR